MSEANQIERIVIRHCPRCGGRPSAYTELWTGHTIEFYINVDSDSVEFTNMEPGHSTKVIGECSICNHLWTLRGIRWVRDLEILSQ